jgi:hypothetical protein
LCSESHNHDHTNWSECLSDLFRVTCFITLANDET